jgi:dUTP pyrophosphatase
MKFIKLHPSAQLPIRQSDGAAGYDLHTLDSHHVGGVEVCDTGVGIEIPPGYVGLIRDRSGHATKHGLTVLAGVVDSDYEGSIKVVLSCTKGTAEVIAGERIAQIVVVPCLMSDPYWGEFSGSSKRGANGFGHTGQ